MTTTDQDNDFWLHSHLWPKKTRPGQVRNGCIVLVNQSAAIENNRQRFRVIFIHAQNQLEVLLARYGNFTKSERNDLLEAVDTLPQTSSLDLVEINGPIAFTIKKLLNEIINITPEQLAAQYMGLNATISYLFTVISNNYAHGHMFVWVDGDSAPEAHLLVVYSLDQFIHLSQTMLADLFAKHPGQFQKLLKLIVSCPNTAEPPKPLLHLTGFVPTLIFIGRVLARAKSTPPPSQPSGRKPN